MANEVLFIQGGGDDGYAADANMVSSLTTSLGGAYVIHYPELQSDESAPDFGWMNEIERHLSELRNDEVILAGHSLGASMILKYLSEKKPVRKFKGIFLIATPFWGGDADWQAGLKLTDDFASRLPANTPVFFYHCIDDEEVPFSHFGIYKEKVRNGIFHALGSGGHQLNDDLTPVADDIKNL